MTSTLRIAGSAVILFLAAFLLGQGLFAARPQRPDSLMPTFQLAGPNTPGGTLGQSAISDADRVRDHLRHQVLDFAKALGDDPCSPPLKKHYVNAVINYTRAWIRIAPCLGTHDCGAGDSQMMDRAARAFGSPLDLKVRDAMRTVHAKRSFGIDDFPIDTVTLVSQLVADGEINPVVDPRFDRVANFQHLVSCVGQSH